MMTDPVEQKEWAEGLLREWREMWPGAPSRLWEQAILDQALRRVISLAGEVERLRGALRTVKVEPHGHPGRHDKPLRPVPDEQCSVCSFIAAALSPLPSERKGP